jgi:predicted nucleic acid-binding protein
MRIIVSDSSCLIDLRKASLLDAFLGLPFEILIPNTLFEDELLKFTEAQKKGLLDAGLKVVDIPGAGVLRARQLMIENPHISLHDAFAFVLAEMHRGCILLTGDRRLRTLASASQIAVHGVLWVVDQMYTNGLSAKGCHDALVGWSNDPAIRLPARELTAAIKRFAELL